METQDGVTVSIRNGEIKYEEIKKTFFLGLNTFTHILIGVVVFMVLCFAASILRPGIMQLHIVLCVLGYQFFMVEAVLLLSNFNAWTMLLPPLQKKYLHLTFILVGVAFAASGSILMMMEKTHNFESAHGILGVSALVLSFLSTINGVSLIFLSKISRYISGKVIRMVHAVSGTLTLVISSACLCVELDSPYFKSWASEGVATSLIIIIALVLIVLVVERGFDSARRYF